MNVVSARIVFWLMLCIGVQPLGALAQEAVASASLSGVVTDPQGAAIAGAQVIARRVDTNVVAEAMTDQQGRFRFPYLRVGAYEVRIRKQDFAEATRQLTLTVGSAFDLSVTLAIGTVTADVLVTGESTLIETVRTQIAGTVSATEAKNLPLNGRNFLDLALLVPGVSQTNVGSAQLFAETSAVPGPGLSVSSQRNFSNSFIIDGLSANDDAAGLSGIPAGVDAVDQFQVVTSGGQAEFGRALGGYVNVVTKSGTNRTQGDVYGFFRDDSLNARNPLLGDVLPMDQKQYGFSLGGPVRSNRTFYFTNFEQRRLNQSGLTTISSATTGVINARLAAVSYPGTPVTTGVYPNPVRTSNFLAKIDHEVNGRDQLGIRYGQYNATALNSRGAGGTGAPSASAGLDNIDQSLAFLNTLILTDRTVNETRAQIAYGNLEAPPTDLVGPAVNIPGVASFGTSSGAPTRRQNTMFEFVDNLSHQAGSHALRAGIDFLFNDDTITYPRAFRGSYQFSSLANFLTGVYNNAGFTQTFAATVVSQTNPNLGVYVQDEWKAGRNLTVNAGLRYDLQFLETIETDRNNLSPRVGVAWSPSAAGRTIVRGSAGIFFDRVPLRALANALLSAGNTTDPAGLHQVSISLSPTQSNAPVFPNILSGAVPTTALVNFTTMDRHMQNAYSRQASVEVEQQVGRGGTLSVGYQYVRGVNLIVQINQNVPSCVAAGSNNGCRPNPSFANNNQYRPDASSSYHGVHLSFVQRPTTWGSYRVSYTVSKAMDNVGEFFFSSPIDPFDLSKDWARSDDDQRHRLVVNGAVNTPSSPGQTAWQRVTNDFQLSATLLRYSSLPLNITSGVTTVQGTAGRPVVNGEFIGRNTGTGPDFLTLNARLSRSFRVGPRTRVEALIEGFNLMNRQNVVTINGNFGAGAYPTNPSPTFGQVTAVAEPRVFQIGVRASF